MIFYLMRLDYAKTHYASEGVSRKARYRHEGFNIQIQTKTQYD